MHQGLDVALSLVGDRWSLQVVHLLREGPLRFAELAEGLRSIAPNILTNRLRALESNGLVVATLYQRRPPRAEYRLTTRGHDLSDTIDRLASWGARLAGLPELPFHAACGTSLSSRWWCPTCELSVDDPETEDTIRV